MARTPTRLPARRNAVTSVDVDVDLPTPGDPVRPMTQAWPTWGINAAMTSRSAGDAFSTKEIRRPTARASPRRARSTHSSTERCDIAPTPLGVMPHHPSVSRGDATLLGRNAEDQRVALAAAAAERRSPDSPAAAAQLERERQGEPGAGGADRVAESDRPTVDVDL